MTMGQDKQRHLVITATGDVYQNYGGPRSITDCNGNTVYPFNCAPVYIGNFWQGGPVPTSPDTWSGVKGKYEGEK